MVIVPSADFMQDISRSYNRSLGIAIASVCLSLLIGMLGAALRGSTDAERRRLARQALGIIRRGLQPDAAA